jgi:alanine racemase
MNDCLRPTRLNIDLSAIKHNVLEIKKKLSNNTEIMPVIKANGYGSGAYKIIDTLLESGIKRVAVAIADEGVALREQGVNVPIVIINQTYETEVKKIVEYDLICAVADINFVNKLNEEAKKYNKIAKVHVEIDSGMGRIGVKPINALEFIKDLLGFQNIEIEGIFTHFSSADSDEKYTLNQISQFEDVLSKIKKNNIDIKYIHACNSAGILNFPAAHYNLVRPGIMIYGYYPDVSVKDKISLKPCMVLESKIVFLKEVEEGIYISYNKTFKTKRKSIIATIPIGYGDGLPRMLSNKGFVVIKNEKVPIIGNVCMDALMVDVTDLRDIKTGDNVYIFDNVNITVEDIAKECNTINYEIISTLGVRIPKVYSNN